MSCWHIRTNRHIHADRHAYRQTDKHTHTLIAVLRTLTNGEVTIRLHKGTYRLCFNHATSVCRPIVLASLGRHLGLPSYTLGLCLRCTWRGRHARVILVNIINLRGIWSVSAEWTYFIYPVQLPLSPFLCHSANTNVLVRISSPQNYLPLSLLLQQAFRLRSRPSYHVWKLLFYYF